MSDMGELIAANKTYIKKARSHKIVDAIRALNSQKISYQERNDGYHFIIDGGIDFWPLSGKFIRRKDGQSGHGVKRLLKMLGVS